MYCLYRNKLKILKDEAVKQLVDEEMLKFIKSGMSLEEMFIQQDQEIGSFNKAIEETIKRFNNKTENVEIAVSLELSKLYDFGPLDQVMICFEMKNDFNKEITTLLDLTKNIKSETHIDCAIRFSGDKECRFQIKRYPFKYLSFDQKSIKSYFEKVLCEKYSNMNDTNLIILLQPTEGGGPVYLKFFKEIHRWLISKQNQISFGEVSFLLNVNMKNITLFRVFPDFKKSITELNLTSHKYKELQSRWESEMRKKYNKN